MAETVLSINHLQKKFGKFEALKDITFDVQKERSLVLLDQMVPVNQLPFERY